MLDNAAAKKGLKVFWLSTGKDDFLIETSRSTVKLLERHGFTPKYVESEAGHTWLNWRDYLSSSHRCCSSDQTRATPLGRGPAPLIDVGGRQLRKAKGPSDECRQIRPAVPKLFPRSPSPYARNELVAVHGGQSPYGLST